jgi:hypothetical protein
MFGAIPLNPMEGVVVADIVEGSRGSVLLRDMIGFMDAMMVSRDGSGLGMAGELSL